MSQRLEKLENTIMELGTEIYRLRQELQHMSRSQTKMFNTLKGVQTILDEKGIVSSEDFETVVDLQRILEQAEPAEGRDPAKYVKGGLN